MEIAEVRKIGIVVFRRLEFLVMRVVRHQRLERVDLDIEIGLVRPRFFGDLGGELVHLVEKSGHFLHIWLP